MSRFRDRVVVVLCVAAVGSQLAGCGRGRYELAPVRGRVMSCHGKPAAGGTVVFMPIDAPDKTGRPGGQPGNASEGPVGEDGTFTLTFLGRPGGDGALIGPHRILFRMPPTKRPNLLAEERAIMSPEEIKATEAEFARRPVYPPLPCSDKITPEEVEVKPGENDFLFTLPPK